MNNLDDFNKSVLYLLKTAEDIRDMAYGSSETPILWTKCIDKFITVYAAKPSEKFIPMFRKFSEENSASLSVPFFLEVDNNGKKTRKPNDEWLKHYEQNFVRKDSSSWNPDEIKCKGKIIYINSNEEYRFICIPITEFYLMSIQLAANSNDNIKAKALPARVIYALFSILYFAIPDFAVEKPMLESNIKILKDHLDIFMPGGISETTQSPNFGSGLQNISNVIEKIAKSSGLDKKGDFKADDIANNLNGFVAKISNFMSDENAINAAGEKIKSVYEQYNVNSKGNTDISTVIKSLGTTLSSEKTLGIINEFIPGQQNTPAVIATLPPPPEQQESSSSNNDDDACDQC